jgi:hypothetical protein
VQLDKKEAAPVNDDKIPEVEPVKQAPVEPIKQITVEPAVEI